MLTGMRVVASDLAMSKVWVFPFDRFVIYEASDEPWCRQLGIGHEETRPGAFMVGGTCYMHPTLIQKMERFR